MGKPSQSVVFDDLGAAKLPDRPLHLAVGMFDGVHLGHQAVIETAVQSARASNGISGVLTFWPHPSRLFKPDDPVKMIMTPEVKAEALASHNIEYIIQQPFNREFAGIEANNFVQYLKTNLPNLNSIHVGSNWKFGKRRIGDISMLVQLGLKAGVHVIHVERVYFDGEPVSSTRIRRHLESGEMEAASALLGEVYYSIGTVTKGKRMGSKLGFPTLNIPWISELVPPLGVYCVEVQGLKVDGMIPSKGVANFGVRPTVETASEPVLEIHLLEDCRFGIGDSLKVRWYRFLRPEKKFSDVEALKAQVGKDVAAARDYWA